MAENIDRHGGSANFARRVIVTEQVDPFDLAYDMLKDRDREIHELVQRIASLSAQLAALTAELDRLPLTADGVRVICDGMEIACPKGHVHKLTHATSKLYCTKGDCWSDGCQGDSGSGTYYGLEECTGRGAQV